MLFIDRPTYDESFKFIDSDCNSIADYLFNETNTTFYQCLRRNVIKTYRTFNDIYVPLIDFPVLKVYKQTENENVYDPFISSSFVIAYGLAFTQKPTSGDVSTFVTQELRRNLKNGSILGKWQIDFSNGITTNYESFISNDNTVYRYATINLNIFTMEQPATT